MIKIEEVEIFGWNAAIRGMRNPYNSWDKSDSHFDYQNQWSWGSPHNEIPVCIGENDLKLMKSLSKAGTDHSKFLRMINVTVDITAPLYWWKEFDTYKVGTVANSCSTMHKIHSKEFTLDDFSHEHLSCIDIGGRVGSPYQLVLKNTIRMLNECRELYLQTKDKEYWWQIIQLLAS